MIDNNSIEETSDLRLQFDKRGGLLPVVVQDRRSNHVLMVGYVNESALQQSLQKKLATFWSTSRNTLWTKGETSGDYLKLYEVWVDCDQDALVFRVEALGQGACHTKDASGRARSSCFYRSIDGDQPVQLKLR
ncbi:MAG: phosphoribosyl-AMP cyclohydrolase [Tunicatimonas sp.]